MSEPRQIRYAKTHEGLNIAYQSVGEGPPDLVYIGEWLGHLEANWEEPNMANFIGRLALISRVLLFDKRGVGLSDPVSLRELPSLEAWCDDVSAVMDDIGCERAALVAAGSGGALAITFAAMHPDRITALVLCNATAKVGRADDYLFGVPQHINDSVSETFGRGEHPFPELYLGDAGRDERFMAAWQKYVNRAASPGTQFVMVKMLGDLDLRHVLPAIRVPTLVVHRADDPWTRVEHGRYLAEHIPGAKYVELEGSDHQVFMGDSTQVLDHISEFVTGHKAPIESDRVLATVVFTDIVDSTGHATRLGDRQWRELLDRYDRAVSRELQRFRGREVKATGDGTLATFDGPARAIRCVEAITKSSEDLGVTIRSGIHAGEVEMRRDMDVAGIAVHIAQRVQAHAAGNEVLVSRTVVDLVAGSGIEFEDRGEHPLKGVPGLWRLFALKD
ncbi:MAG TPA: adenylate/guanylate cyclase domain-containing protein [Acidimicrobiales bacterium]